MEQPPWEYIGIGRVTLDDPKTGVRKEFAYYIRDLPTPLSAIDDRVWIYVSTKLSRDKRSAMILHLLQAQYDQEKRLGVVNGTYDSGLDRPRKPRVIKSAAE